MSTAPKSYLERMKIADAKRLAVALDIPLTTLLDASISLCENVRNARSERVSDLPKLGYTNVPLAI